jgi:hypothetical protein
LDCAGIATSERKDTEDVSNQLKAFAQNLQRIEEIEANMNKVSEVAQLFGGKLEVFKFDHSLLNTKYSQTQHVDSYEKVH